MFDTKERATLAANIAGSMAAGEGWNVPTKRLVRKAEEILAEIELTYKPRVEAEHKKFIENHRKLASLNPFVI